MKIEITVTQEELDELEMDKHSLWFNACDVFNAISDVCGNEIEVKVEG